MKDIPVPAVNPKAIFHFKCSVVGSQLCHRKTVTMTYIYQSFLHNQILFIVVAVADMYGILILAKEKIETSPF